jgi:hypothetical protein
MILTLTLIHTEEKICEIVVIGSIEMELLVTRMMMKRAAMAAVEETTATLSQ